MQKKTSSKILNRCAFVGTQDGGPKRLRRIEGPSAIQAKLLRSTSTIFCQSHSLKGLIGFVVAVTIAIVLGFSAERMSTSAQAVPQTQDSPEVLGSISGQVTSDGGAPLADVTVTVLVQEYEYGFFGFSYPVFNVLQTVTTDSNGQYWVSSLATNIYRVEAAAPGTMHVRQRWMDTTVTPATESAADVPVSGNNRNDIDFILETGGKISGLLSVAGETDFDYYTIGIYELNDESFYAAVDRFQVAGDEGHYLSQALPAGTYRVCASLYKTTEFYADSLASECYADHVFGVEDAEDVTVAVGETTTGVDFELGESAQYGAISGTLVGSDGKPAANVEVEAYPAPFGDGIHQRTTTDSFGRYLLDKLGPYAYYLDFRAKGTPYLSQYYGGATSQFEAEEVVVGSGDILLNVDDELTLGGAISGTVDVQGDFPATGASVSVYAIDSAVYFRAEFPVDPDTGEYQAFGLPEASYDVSASLDAPSGTDSSVYLYGTPDEGSLPISVTLGSSVGDIDISLTEDTYDGRIEGTVTNGTDPIGGIRVELIDPDRSSRDAIFFTFTEEDGTYGIDGLRAGEYRLSFMDPGAAYLPAVAPDSGTLVLERGGILSEIDVALAQAAAISGTVLLENGDPAVGYSMLLTEFTDGEWYPLSEQLIEEGGRYEFASLYPGQYRLSVLTPYPEDGTYVSIDERTVYQRALEVEGGVTTVVAGVGQPGGDVAIQDAGIALIRLGNPADGEVAKIPQLEPILFVPFIGQ